MPHEVKNVKEFDDIISTSNLIVIHFSAKWAEQCTQINDVLDELAKQEEFKTTSVKFCSCEAEDLADISLRFKIVAAPTILFFRNGKEIDRVDGADVAKLTTKVKQHSADNNSKAPTQTTPTVPLEERLKSLINRHKVMIFMKGNRETPRCGFSRTLIQIINDTGVEYDTFDILQDEEVRQGLKVFSDWPTYPQLYINGELIGGLDIIKEMQAAGELEQSLKA